MKPVYKKILHLIKIALLAVLLFLSLLLGFFLWPLIPLHIKMGKLKKTARYEAVLDASLVLMADVMKQNTMRQDFDPYDPAVAAEPKMAKIIQALAPVEPQWIYVDLRDKTSYFMRIECGGGFSHFGYAITAAPGGDITISYVTESDYGKALKTIPYNLPPIPEEKPADSDTTTQYFPAFHSAFPLQPSALRPFSLSFRIPKSAFRIFPCPPISNS